MKLIAIKTKDNFYISQNIEFMGYYDNKIGAYLFDGEPPKKTFREYWWSVNKEPKEITKVLPEKDVNIRWELKSGYPETDLTPNTLLQNPNYEDSDYYDVSGLYEKKCDKEKAGIEKIDFELIIIAEDENFKIIKEDFKVNYNLLDQITIPEILLPTKPCSIGGVQFYHIIRKYIKDNIDGRYARISSDYDFCLTVEKKLSLTEPKGYKVDIGTKRKANYITKYHTERTIKIYETSPSGYSNYPTQHGISGINYEDLNKNINNYLEDLIKKINQPLKECPCCKGDGAVLIEDETTSIQR